MSVSYFNGIKTTSGREYLFPTPVSDNVTVQVIKYWNHPAYIFKTETFGLFAKNKICKDDIIGYYAGELKSIDDAHDDWSPYLMQVTLTSKFMIDAGKCGNELRYINDSSGISTPNVSFLQSVDVKAGRHKVCVVRALRDIEPKEEILVSYGDNYWKTLEDFIYKFKCDHNDCEYRTNEIKKLKQHIYIKHTYTFKCKYCDKTYTTKQELSYHLNAHTGKKPFKCTTCDKKYSYSSSLYSHIRDKHSIDNKYKCFNCDECLPSKWKLDSHIYNVHTKATNMFLCPVDGCDKRLKTKESLRHHNRMIHGKKKMITCKVKGCTKTTKTTQNMSLHVMAVHEKKRWLCDVCNKDFSISVQKNRHYKTKRHLNNININKKSKTK